MATAIRRRYPILFPVTFRPIGFILAAGGILLLLYRFYYGVKPEFLEVKVFAFYSSYIDTKIMTVIKNQVAEEIGGLLLLGGLFLFAFAREREENDLVDDQRFKAFFISMYGNMLFLFLSIVFVYGFGFLFVMMLNMVVGLLVYIVAFRVLLYKNVQRSFAFKK